MSLKRSTPKSLEISRCRRGPGPFASLALAFLAIALCMGAVLPAQTLPKPTGYVDDFARVIDETSKQQIEQLCQELESKTGSQLAVVTLSTLNGEPIEDYAVKLFHQWGIGKKDQSNGLLLLVAAQERRTRIEVGYGLEPVITDGYSGEVLRGLRPYFRANQFGPGLYAAANQLAGRIAQNAGVTLSAKPVELPHEREKPLLPFHQLIVGGLIVLALFILPYLLGGGGGGSFTGPPMTGGYRRGGYYGGFGGFGGGSDGGGGSGGFGGFGGGSTGGGGSSSDW